MHFKECKENANKSSIVLQVDFSENYRTSYQDEVQNAFFNYNQVGLFNAVVWSGPDSEIISYALVSDDVSHDKYSIHVCLTDIITDLKKRFSSLENLSLLHLRPNSISFNSTIPSVFKCSFASTSIIPISATEFFVCYFLG